MCTRTRRGCAGGLRSDHCRQPEIGTSSKQAGVARTRSIDSIVAEAARSLGEKAYAVRVAPACFRQQGGGFAWHCQLLHRGHQDLRREDIRLWGYFCQISDSTTSYGSYSGAVPNEKITWGKLGVDTPSYIIESDATIVAPLIFAKVLGW